MSRSRADPIEWARRRQASMERAKQIKSDRESGKNEEQYSFKPQINKRPSFLSKNNSTDSGRINQPVSDDPLEQPLPASRKNYNPNNIYERPSSNQHKIVNNDDRLEQRPSQRSRGKENPSTNPNINSSASNNYYSTSVDDNSSSDKPVFKSKFMLEYQNKNGIIDVNVGQRQVNLHSSNTSQADQYKQTGSHLSISNPRHIPEWNNDTSIDDHHSNTPPQQSNSNSMNPSRRPRRESSHHPNAAFDPQQNRDEEILRRLDVPIVPKAKMNPVQQLTEEQSQALLGAKENELNGSHGRSRLALLKSKIRRSESGNGIRQEPVRQFDDHVPKTAPINSTPTSTSNRFQPSYDSHSNGNPPLVENNYDPSIEISRNDRMPRRGQVSHPNNAKSKVRNSTAGYDDDDFEDEDYDDRNTISKPKASSIPRSPPQSKQNHYPTSSMQERSPKYGGGQGYNMVDFDDGDDQNTEQEQIPCPDCGRKFNPIPYEKHVKICKAIFLNKRKTFDSLKMRVQDNPELAKMVLQKQREEKQMAKKKDGLKAIAEVGSKKSKWKEQSKQFREAMRAARQYSDAKANGDPLPPPVVSAPDDSLIPCPHCNRRFNQKAADRHIPQCQNIKAKPSTLKRGAGGGGGVNGSLTKNKAVSRTRF